ncbi:MAG: hypothetical protein HC831_08960 [Chloroflexia bacterium]|nr:hypothetical protein [Chloroflexia bacterium]
MKKLLLLILFVLNLVLLQAQEVKFISVNQADTSLQNINFKRLSKLLEKDSLTADTLATPTKWMLKLQKKLSKQQRQDSNIYIFFCPSEKDSLKAFLPLSGKYGYVLFDTAKTGVYGPGSLAKKLCTVKYQWDAIHDPNKMLFAWAQDEEEGALMSDYLVLKIEELAKSLGLKLGENAFVTVHSFRCSNIGDLSGASPLDVSGYSDREFTKFKPQRIIIANSENEGNSDVVNIAILFRINDDEVKPEDKSSTGIVLPGMEPPFLGVLQESGELVECPNQLSTLDEFGCVDDNSLVAQLAEEDYRGLYISKVLTAIHECLDEQEIDNSEGKVGDLFYTRIFKRSRKRRGNKPVKTGRRFIQPHWGCTICKQ